MRSYFPRWVVALPLTNKPLVIVLSCMVCLLPGLLALAQAFLLKRVFSLVWMVIFQIVAWKLSERLYVSWKKAANEVRQ